MTDQDIPRAKQAEQEQQQHDKVTTILGQVAHCGSAGTLDWGPMWSDSQSTCHPNTPLTPPKWPSHFLHPRNPPMHLMPPYPFWPKYLQSLPAPNTPLTPYTPVTPIMASNTPTPPSFLTIFMQLKCSFSIVVIFNWHHFATDHLHTDKMLIFYHRHFQLSSLCNWLFSGVCPVHNIPSLGVKGTSSVLWSLANFCSISQNMHYKAPIASQHWKTNKVVWTWKDDWPLWRTSTYERHFTREGNYLVIVLT